MSVRGPDAHANYFGPQFVCKCECGRVWVHKRIVPLRPTSTCFGCGAQVKPIEIVKTQDGGPLQKRDEQGKQRVFVNTCRVHNKAYLFEGAQVDDSDKRYIYVSDSGSYNDEQKSVMDSNDDGREVTNNEQRNDIDIYEDERYEEQDSIMEIYDDYGSDENNDESRDMKHRKSKTESI